MMFLNRSQGVLFAFLLMVLLAGRVELLVTTQAVHQIDFWLVWLGCMVILTLPILLLESALAKRTQALPLQALPVLTRDADASTRWRSMGWLGLVTVLLLAGALSSQASGYAFSLLKPRENLNVMHTALPYVVIVLVAALSYLSRWLPLVGSLLIVVLIGLGLLHPTVSSWQFTHFAFAEWAGAVELALVSTGVGLGIYWQTAIANTRTTRQKILPIWIAQVVGGAIVAFGLVSLGSNANANQDVMVMVYGFALFSGAAMLLAFARQQMTARGLPVIVTWVVLLASLAAWILPIKMSLLTTAMALAIIVAATYAIFAGWKMKSSHLRKALEFKNEGLYNLWRVMVRLVVPLAAVIALVGLVEQYIMWIQ
jgi:hypothetical protein